MVGKLFVFFLVLSACNAFGTQLKQVLVLSRHNLRTPLSENLAHLTPKEWPKWNADVGSLTRKGVLLENYMGEYFSAWMKREGLLPEGCPEEKSLYIYANVPQRTKATARAFVMAAFHNCNVKIHFTNKTYIMDPIFNPVIHNGSDGFKKTVLREMEENLKNTDLKDVYEQLNDITDIKNSIICKQDGCCDLAGNSNEVVLAIGEEPDVTGPLTIANSMVDSFLMSFYDGQPYEDIAWGGIKNETQWRSFTKITKENLSVRFNTTASRDITRPLLKCIKERIGSNTKFNLLVGHDSNLFTVLISMGFKYFSLPEQFELTPIGSKLVFQKWTDGENDFLKVEFVYQSANQLRNVEILNLNNPPKNITMFLKDCKTDTNGFCPWKDFETILNNLVG